MDESPSDSQEPSAQGTFAQTPLAHVLQHALDRQLTGTFELSGRSGPAGTFLVIEGKPAKARTMVDHYLVRVMESAGIMSPAQVHNWLPRLLMSEELHGRALVRQKVLTDAQLADGLKAQLLKQMQTIVELPADTIFKYYDGVDNLASWGGETPVRLDPGPIIWSSLRALPPWLHVHPALDRLSQVAIRLKRDADATRFGFDFGQRATIDLVRRRPWRVEELLAAAPIPPETAQLIVYCLLLTKQVDFVQAVEADDGSDDAVSPQPGSVADRSPRPTAVAEPVRDSLLVQEWEAGHGPVSVAKGAVEMRGPRAHDPRAESEPPSREPTPAPPPPASRSWVPSRDEAPGFGRPTPVVMEAVRDPGEEVIHTRPTPAAFAAPEAVDASSAPRSTARPPADPLPRAAFATPLPPRPPDVHTLLTPVPLAPPEDNPFATPVPPPPSLEAPSERTTAAPPPDLSEPGYDVSPPAAARTSPPPRDEGPEVYTRPTAQRMNAVSAEEVAAYIASQEKAAREKSVGPPPMKPSGELPRPPTPAMFGPAGRSSLFRPPTPPPFSPAPRPNAPSPPLRIPRPPTPAMFGPARTASVSRPAIVPPEPVARPTAPAAKPGAPFGQPAALVTKPAPPMAKPAAAVAKPVAPSKGKTPDQVILVPPVKPSGGNAEGAAARLALGASAKAMVDLTNKAASEERISSIAPLSSRKTLEFAVDKALIDATVGPPSSRDTVPTPADTKPAAPPPEPAGGLTLELDSPWDDGWGDDNAPSKGK